MCSKYPAGKDRLLALRKRCACCNVFMVNRSLSVVVYQQEQQSGECPTFSSPPGVIYYFIDGGVSVRVAAV